MKKHSQEEIREAIMRLAMCARNECEMCKYQDRPKTELPSDECKKRATKNMNIVADVCLCTAPQTPTYTTHDARGYKRKTLCWDCANNGGRCSWSKDFTPVDGWTAIPTKIPAQVYKGDGRMIDSYCVCECPEFELMERLKNRRKKGDML